ncbi:MAG: two component, sigma54 specific, transcriptional regulator, Fis family [Polaromonas sp.]|nr:two component, sigma54 specific, transcriptional regulator, Fis family [Polaromonas sp.]
MSWQVECLLNLEMSLGHALIVEAEAEASEMLSTVLVRDGHTVTSAATLGAARRLLAMQRPDLLLLDLDLPDGNGLELLADTELVSDAEVVLMADEASLETTIQALRLGVADYMVKPISPQHLKTLMSRLIRPSQLKAELDEATEFWRETGRFGHLIGASPLMQRVYQQISRVAGTAVSVFIHGESGTGKELVARAVHDASRRRDRPFLAVNCGALSPHLIESEIFGHERGSFTGADRRHQGFFERAHGGTLFLDEVTEMPLELQVKLLRVLEGGTFMRVGSTELQKTDVRIIAATNRHAAQAVANGLMREDLLYRLNVFPIDLPPLREREGDIPLLANSFLQDFQKREQQAPLKYFTAQALERLANHRWPGNVRELRNVVQRAWVMALGVEIDDEWLPISPSSQVMHERRRAIGSPLTKEAAQSGAPILVAPVENPRLGGLVVEVGSQLAAVEKQVILATFEHCNRHKEATAAVLGISMKTLYNRLKEYQHSV